MMPPPPAARKKSRKGLVIGIISVLVVLLIAAVLVVLFLPSDTRKAKDLINKAAPLVNDIQPKLKEVGTQLNGLFTDIASVTSAAQFDSVADPIRKNVAAIAVSLNKAKGYLEQVQDLGAGEDYKKYAALALQLTATELEETKLIAEYLDYMSQQFKSAEAGNPVDTNAIASATSTFITTLTATNDKAEKLATEAADLKSSKNL
jgi:competence protein ComGC